MEVIQINNLPPEKERIKSGGVYDLKGREEKEGREGSHFICR